MALVFMLWSQLALAISFVTFYPAIAGYTSVHDEIRTTAK